MQRRKGAKPPQQANYPCAFASWRLGVKMNLRQTPAPGTYMNQQFGGAQWWLTANGGSRNGDRL
jgi:hypothetical protein